MVTIWSDQFTVGSPIWT